ncbi:hypothetical protein [Nitrosococcus wardiae]|uniref:CopG family transcriptional regulator n=1 Tax=Nitrosococcus wardiae TaxID=1814290 RepID=A0A4P7BXI6_9GAMM|nr:hypothetical protein [Nitrosococcus wardiae]QBQ54027.1 hypothetical protein E3U44_05545 [Nitrosococcus wardiae]
MTKLLKKAFEEASKLPEIEQNSLAKWMLEELEADKKWDETFAESEDILDQLADEALEAHKQGKTKPLDIDKL